MTGDISAQRQALHERSRALRARLRRTYAVVGSAERRASIRHQEVAALRCSAALLRAGSPRLRTSVANALERLAPRTAAT